MRQLLQHRLKTNIHGQTGHFQPRGNYVKKPLLAPIALKAIKGWTGVVNCYQPQVAYTPTQAVFAGNSALTRQITVSNEGDMSTISLWFVNNAGATVNKIYDIGLNSDTVNETTRLRIDNLGNFEVLYAHDDAGWSVIASVLNNAVAVDTWHHAFIVFRTDKGTGDGSQKLEVWLDGALLGTDTTFNPTPDTTYSIRAGDQVVIGARHKTDTGVSQGHEGKLADIWSSSEYLEPSIYVPYFIDTTATDIPNGFAAGLPRDLGGGVVAGVTPGNWLGGSDYSIADWNNGRNKGTGGDYIILPAGDPIT